MHGLKPNVLIIDDDPVYRFAAVRTIAATGLSGHITECNDGQEALDYLTNNASTPTNLPDIIFLDLNMPVMNGWDFLKAFHSYLHNVTKSIYVYIVTSSIDTSDMERSKEFGHVTDYLIKPVFKETFAQILNTVHA